MKVIRFKDDGSYSILDMEAFINIRCNEVEYQSPERCFKYVWRTRRHLSLRYTVSNLILHQAISLNELPEFVRALIVIHDI